MLFSSGYIPMSYIGECFGHDWVTCSKRVRCSVF